MGAYDEIAKPEVRRLFSGKLITGVELVSILNGQIVDILGYGVDPQKIRDIIEKIDARRDLKVVLKIMYEEYLKRGIRLPRPMEEYDTKIHLNPRRFVFAQLVEIPENHAFFLDFEAHTDEPLTYYRHELYNKESPLYVDCSSLSFDVDEVIKAIHQAGGRAFLAHSFCYTPDIYDHLDEITDQHRFDGLECFYPAFTPEQTEAITSLCARKQLLMSGGSDFHGAIRPQISLGIGKGDFSVSKDVAPWIQNMF